MKSNKHCVQGFEGVPAHSWYRNEIITNSPLGEFVTCGYIANGLAYPFQLCLYVCVCLCVCVCVCVCVCLVENKLKTIKIFSKKIKIKHITAGRNCIFIKVRVITHTKWAWINHSLSIFIDNCMKNYLSNCFYFFLFFFIFFLFFVLSFVCCQKKKRKTKKNEKQRNTTKHTQNKKERKTKTKNYKTPW